MQGNKTLTKRQLIQMLEEDKRPMDSEVAIYLECTNDDKGILGTITNVEYSKTFNNLMVYGEYEESE